MARPVVAVDGARPAAVTARLPERLRPPRPAVTELLPEVVMEARPAPAPVLRATPSATSRWVPL
jgi:hypothetical protein